MRISSIRGAKGKETNGKRRGNEEVKGKIDAYRMFKARLLLELTHVFPKEMAVYRATRGDERGGGGGQ